MELVANLDGTSFDNLNVSAELAIDGTRYLSVKSDYRYQNENDLVFWNGAVDVLATTGAARQALSGESNRECKCSGENSANLANTGSGYCQR